MSSMYPVIMAGGSGTRFWPLSRRNRPKQFLRIGTERTLIEETVARLAPIAGSEGVYVVAGRHHAPRIRELLPQMPEAQLIIEPCARNTAPCIGLAAIHIRRRDPDAVMAVLPADHHIGDTAGFRTLVAAAIARAADGVIVTLGIQPTRPETGYGYIHYDPQSAEAVSVNAMVDGSVGNEPVEVCTVRRFVEKPPRETACAYLADGSYLWNSGMFFFTASRILDDIARFLPDLHTALGRIDAAIDTPDYDAVLASEFAAIDGISIDYGVMERTEQVYVIRGDVGWNDVGHWAALADFADADDDGNVIEGRVIAVESGDNIVRAGERLVALVGVRDLVVVDTPDALLICPRDRAQDVRQIVERLASDGSEELL